MYIYLSPLDLVVLMGCGNWVGRKGQGRDSAPGHAPNWCHHVQRIYLFLSHSLQSCAALCLPCCQCPATTRGITSRHGKKHRGRALVHQDCAWTPCAFLPQGTPHCFFSAFPLSCPQGPPPESESIRPWMLHT